MFRFYAAVLLAFLTGSGSALAADYPEPKHGQWIAKDFKLDRKSTRLNSSH